MPVSSIGTILEKNTGVTIFTLMINDLYTSGFSIYGTTENDNMYVAVPNEFLRTIRQYATEYQGLCAVPGDKLVSGILFEAKDRQTIINTDAFARPQIIPINRLRFAA